MGKISEIKQKFVEEQSRVEIIKRIIFNEKGIAEKKTQLEKSTARLAELDAESDENELVHYNIYITYFGTS